MPLRRGQPCEQCGRGLVAVAGVPPARSVANDNDPALAFVPPPGRSVGQTVDEKKRVPRLQMEFLGADQTVDAVAVGARRKTRVD